MECPEIVATYIERTVGEVGHKIIQTLARREVGFNALLEQLRINNHRLRSELAELVKKNYIRRQKPEQYERRRGRPEEPYNLTEKGTEYVKAEKELRGICTTLLTDLASEKITEEEWNRRHSDAYLRIGVDPPTKAENREEEIASISQHITKILHASSMILVIETNRNGTYRIFYLGKPPYALQEDKDGYRITIKKQPATYESIRPLPWL